MKIKLLNDDGFESVNDFTEALLYGREILFKWNDIEYGIFYIGNDEDEFSICVKGTDNEKIFNKLDDLLNCEIQGQLLKDIVTQVDILLRNV